MTVAQPEGPLTGGIRTLEVRWIFPGELETAVAGWFGRFTAGTESRQDTYLLRPHLPGLSVKVRGGGALEVKVYGGSRGILEVAGRARGRMESWQKWSFPCGRPSHGGKEVAGWRPVHKRRRIGWFSLASEPVLARAPALGEEPACAVELTEVFTGGEAWWSLGFEATGPPTRSTACLRPAPRSCSPRHCRVAWMLAWRTPGPMRSGCGSSQLPRAGNRDRPAHGPCCRPGHRPGRLAWSTISPPGSSRRSPRPCSAPTTRPTDADVCRFLAAIRVRCGRILLPPCCHEDQKGLTASGDQAPDLHFLVAGAGFEPATSGL